MRVFANRLTLPQYHSAYPIPDELHIPEVNKYLNARCIANKEKGHSVGKWPFLLSVS
jgi:hypothetical protein